MNINTKDIIQKIHRRTGIPEIDVQLTFEVLREIVIEAAAAGDHITLEHFLRISFVHKKSDGIYSNIAGRFVPFRYRIKPVARFSTRVKDTINGLEPKHQPGNDKKKKAAGKSVG